MNQDKDELKLSILKNRARALAKETEKSDANLQFMEIIEFRLAWETYAVESKYIKEIYPLRDFTPIPGTPSFVLGLANVRGQILSIIDLKKFFNLPEKGLGELNKIIVVRNELMEFGILADAIIGARRMMLDDVQQSPPTVSGIGAEYLKGITKERMAVLDMEKILNDPKIVVDQHGKYK
jgi:purine-binding chemotaxis protein CheW